MLGGGWQPLLCPVGGPAHGLSPEKFHFWAELEPGSCREAVGVVGLLLAGLHGCSACRRGSGPLPKNHFQLKRSGNGWTRPKIKAVLGCSCGESRAVPGVRGSGGVRQGCPRVRVRLVEQGMLRVLCGPSGAEGKPLAVGYRAGGGRTVQCW